MATEGIPEAFSSSKVQLVVGEKKFILRILKMQDSTLLFLSNHLPECFDEMAVAMPLPSSAGKNEVASTILVGDHMRLNSSRLAEKLSKRFGRPFFVSFNAEVDRITEPKLEEKLADYIRSNKEKFV